jgi:hypothetical protein
MAAVHDTLPAGPLATADLAWAEQTAISRPRRFGLLGIVALAACAVSARASTISYTDTISIQRTTWASSVSVPQFDPALGTLDSIQFSLTGYVTGAARFESGDSEPATVEMTLNAKITLLKPDLTTLIVVPPLVQTSDNVSAFDGVLDFAGTSGRSYDNLSAQQSDTNFLSSPSQADLTAFVGTGNVVLPVTAEGISHGSGAGNLTLLFLTNAGATVSVEYDYHVPEPGSLGLLAVGCVALIGRRR